MTPEDFQAALDELELRPAELARRLSQASGRQVQQTTVWRYGPKAHAEGKGHSVPPGLALYLRLLLSLKRLGAQPPPH